MATLSRGITLGATETVTNTKCHNLVDLGGVSSIVNADVANGAAITYAKLNLTGGIVNSDVASGAAIAYSKLNLATSIVNADISASAAIVDTKLDTISTAGKVNISALTVGSQAQGDIIYASGATTWARLAPGTSGQYLKTQGASANPTWASPTTYTPRGAVASPDFAVGNFTIDSSSHTLDLSSIVSSGATSILVSIKAKNNTAGVEATFWKTGEGSGAANTRVTTQVANVNTTSDIIISCDTNRIISYQIANTGTWATLDFIVKGWWS